MAYTKVYAIIASIANLQMVSIHFAKPRKP